MTASRRSLRSRKHGVSEPRFTTRGQLPSWSPRVAVGCPSHRLDAQFAVLRTALTPVLLENAFCAAAANEAVQIFEVPENAAKVLEVQKQCAGDLGKFFMMMIPLATQLVVTVITKYGFEANQMGAMAFVVELQKHKNDAEIAGLVRVRAALGARAIAPVCPCGSAHSYEHT